MLAYLPSAVLLGWAALCSLGAAAGPVTVLCLTLAVGCLLVAEYHKLRRRP